MNPKYFIKNIRKITQKQAAVELNISRVHLNNILNGIENASLKLAKKFEAWSGGKVTAIEFLRLDK